MSKNVFFHISINFSWIYIKISFFLFFLLILLLLPTFPLAKKVILSPAKHFEIPNQVLRFENALLRLCRSLPLCIEPKMFLWHKPLWKYVCLSHFYLFM